MIKYLCEEIYLLTVKLDFVKIEFLRTYLIIATVAIAIYRERHMMELSKKTTFTG
jgi:hypothetical protein